ncbi:hypothetical protein [Lutibaculum baratangense]|uniref:Uncharacterized protein n=1 Tax=Lutibaculum baratangense AMV1 TaxID=631454 RepID=V4TCZ5_9HYPH|nr:hypothetical protein [Lutibaculum baratangense]ESR24178.1 hypothetical protein N177_2627 [Lutibaculum baratangense AMV1]
MAVGGAMWKKAQAAKVQRYGYGQQMRKNFVKQREATVAALGNKLFATKVNSGALQVQLSFQMAAERMQEQYKAKAEEINKRLTETGLGNEIDLLA